MLMPAMRRRYRHQWQRSQARNDDIASSSNCGKRAMAPHHPFQRHRAKAPHYG